MEGSGNFVYTGRNSASNLSASAPPFTVDRSNSKSFSDTRFHLSDSYYGASPFTEEWQYPPHPSAPASDLVMDSTGIAGTVPHEYHFSASASVGSSAVWSSLIPAADVLDNAFGYGGSKKPSYSPSVPVFYDDDHNMNLGGDGSVKSKRAYAPNSLDLECGFQRLDGLGYHDGKPAKIVEPGGAVSSVKENIGGLNLYSDHLNRIYQPNEDFWENPVIPNHKYLRTESSTSSYLKFDDYSDRGVSVSSCSMGNKDKNSYLGEKHGSVPYYFSKTRISDASSTYPHYGTSEIEAKFEEFSGRDVKASIPDASNAWSFCKSFSGPVPAVRSCPHVTIRPPPAASIGKTGRNTSYHKAVSRGNADCALDLGSSQLNMPKQQDLGVKPSSEAKEDSYGTSISNFSVKGGDGIASTSEAMPEKFLQSKGILGATIKSRVRSQFSDLDSSKRPAVPCRKVETMKSGEESSDIIDHQNLEVDSPCWRGAPSSQFSFLNAESSSGNLVKKALDECEELGLGKLQSVSYSLEPTFITFDETPQIINIKKNQCTVGAGIDDLYLRKEKNMTEDAKAEADISTVLSGSAEFTHNPNRLIDFGATVSKLMDSTGEDVSLFVENDVPEAVTIAIQAAEDVLYSPVSQEDAAEHVNPRIHVATMTKALHNISELLLFHLSSDSSTLEPENIVEIKKTVSNLNSCLSRKMTGKANEPQPGSSDRVVSRMSGRSIELTKISGAPSKSNEPRDFQNDIRHTPSGSRRDGITCKKDIKTPSALSLNDTDSAVTADDDVAKGIKKVLEENFDFNEEMLMQASLFKDLWLEAEAKLCSLNCKANFNRIKIQIEEIQLKASPVCQENECCAQEIPKASSDPITPPNLRTLQDHVGHLDPKLNTQKSSISGTSMHADDIESSVMAHCNILKSRKETIGTNKEQKTEAFDDFCSEDSIMARLSLLKSRDTSISSIGMEKESGSKIFDGESDDQHFKLRFRPEDETVILQSTKTTDQSKFQLPDDVGYKDLNEFCRNLVDDFTCQSCKNEDNPGLHDSFSLDWEHVRKDDFSWRSS